MRASSLCAVGLSTGAPLGRTHYRRGVENRRAGTKGVGVGEVVTDGDTARAVSGTVRLLRQTDHVRDDTQVGPELLTHAQLAERWQLSRGTLANQRSQGRGPAYPKIAGRVRYRRADIEAYEQSGLVSTH